MDIAYARQLLASLADGVNPATGEVLPNSDSCNQPEVIRALHVAVTELEKAEKRSKQSEKLPENAGKPWTTDDEEKLVKMFDSGRTIKEIRTEFKRTEGAITSRLFRLGKIQNQDMFRFRK